MKKMRYLLFFAMSFATALGWASEAVITANAEVVDFGDVTVGYKVTQRITVTGLNLTDNLTLSISEDRYQQFSVSPSTITPQNAALGAVVTVSVSPFNPYGKTAMLTLSSAGVDDLVIPITANIERAQSLPSNNQLTTYVGGMTSISGTINFPDAVIPPGPDNPVMMSPAILAQVAPGSNIAGYSFTVQGDDCFDAIITKGSTIAKTCDVRITYHPLTIGTHSAAITFTCSQGGEPVTIHVTGTATEQPEPGDINGDGIIAISDVTGLIDMLLCGNDMPPFADVNSDNVVSIKDVTILIDMLLSGN